MASATRRQFVATAAVGAVTASGATSAEPAPAIRDPLQPPYRVWFQPRVFHRSMDLYRGMTIEASGWLDPDLARQVGRASLRWVYGTNHPTADGPGYWEQECVQPAEWPGIAIDEWIPATDSRKEQWIAAGLAAGRQKRPNCFIAVWVTDPTPTLAKLVAQKIVDLVIIQGYTHAAPRYGEHATLAWQTCLRRCQQAVDLGMGSSSIFSFGHVTADANAAGQRLDVAIWRENAAELKERFPQFPGVAFFQDDSDDSPELRAIVQECDRLSTHFWPDAR